ncbi:hypothetical protein F4782DRAFT_246351 [Xylaria castorea]|nr:hypothetical protein F4782DRAFT_246351 [Xylaria castorea]
MAPTAEKVSSEPQEADAWVKVRPRRGRRLADKTSAKTSSRAFTPKEPTISLEQVKQDHGRFSSEWTSSPAHAQLQELLSSHMASTSSRVTKAICFGLGTFDPTTYHWKHCSHIQLAAFLGIVKHLQSIANSQIRCIFQEPLFNSVDKAFITDLGHEVVESPVGFQLVDSETMTFGIHLYRNVCSQIVATCIPAIYIGTSYEAWTEAPGDSFRIDDLVRLKELDQLSTSVEFPDNNFDHIFAPATIHWRQEEQT